MSTPQYLKRLIRNVYDPTWSPSKLKTFETCPRQYFYTYLLPEKIEAPIFPDMAAGIQLHMFIDKFYVKDLTKENFGKPKYKSAKTFANALFGDWQRRINLPLSQRGFGKVRWKDEKEPYKKWRIILTDLAKLIYESYASQEPPLFSEYKLPVLLIDGIKIYGIVDEIRPKLRIRDHKSRAHEVSEFELRYDNQFTTYAASVNFLCAVDNDFARRIGTDDSDLSNLINDPLHIFKKINLEHHYLPTGYVPEGEKRALKIISAPSREAYHFVNLEKRIVKAEDSIRTGQFEPRYGSHCDRCIFKEKCDEDSRSGIKTYIPEQAELFRKAQAIVTPRQRTIGQMKFKFPEVKTENQLEMFR